LLYTIYTISYNDVCAELRLEYIASIYYNGTCKEQETPGTERREVNGRLERHGGSAESDFRADRQV